MNLAPFDTKVVTKSGRMITSGRKFCPGHRLGLGNPQTSREQLMNFAPFDTKVMITSALAADFIDRNIHSTHARAALKKCLKSHDMAWLVGNITVEENQDSSSHTVVVHLKTRLNVDSKEGFGAEDLSAISAGLTTISSNKKLTDVAFVPADNTMIFKYPVEKSSVTDSKAPAAPADKN